MRKYSKKQIKQAEEIFNYLYFCEDEQKSDIIIGFGHFDLQIPKHCGQLLTKGYADTILFTGGMGAGTADLNKSEALSFLDVYKQHQFPEKIFNLQKKSFERKILLLLLRKVLKKLLLLPIHTASAGYISLV